MLKAVFSRFGEEIELTDELWQYDFGQKIQVTGIELPDVCEVHFQYDNLTETKTVTGYKQEDALIIDIPNEALTSRGIIKLYIYLVSSEEGRTVNVAIMHVNRRMKPEGFEVPEDIDLFHHTLLAANEYMQQTKSAKKSAETAANQAEDAKNAAEAAAGSAQASADKAKTSKENAETAAKVAEAAKAAADADKEAAEAAQAKAEAAQVAAENAEVEAKKAQTATETARRETETAKAAVETMQSTVAGYADNAKNAKEAAETAKAEAETAKNDAVQAKEAAEKAKSGTEADREVTEAASKAAQVSAISAEKSAERAETAKEEILMTNEVITGITGEEVSYMRPPFGAWQKKLEWELDVMPVMWTIDPLDWTTNNEDEIVNKVVTQAKENDIILLHDCYESSVNAALRIVDILQKEGFEFVTVDELIMN